MEHPHPLAYCGFKWHNNTSLCHENNVSNFTLRISPLTPIYKHKNKHSNSTFGFVTCIPNSVWLLMATTIYLRATINCSFKVYHFLLVWQGWGMVRVENPKLGAGRVVDQMAPWESFQVLGPHSGVNICDTNSIKRSESFGTTGGSPWQFGFSIGNFR